MPQVTRKRGVPNRNKAPQKLANGEERIPIREWRDKLSIDGKDPNYHYRLVKDEKETGHRVQKFLAAGYEFVKQDEDIKIGEHYVHRVEGVGSIIRVPAGEATVDKVNWLFLMKIKKGWYDQDQKAKQLEIDEMEAQLREPKDELGQYGNVKITDR